MRQLAVLTCLVGILVWSGLGWSATITVTTTEAGVNEDGLCSLAEAIENVNDGNVHTDCVAGEATGNTIELGEGQTYTFPLPDLWSRGSVVIAGNGSTLLGLADFTNQVMVLGSAISIRDLLFTDCSLFWFGDFFNQEAPATLTVERCEFSGKSGIRLGTLNAKEDVTIAKTVFRGIKDWWGGVSFARNEGEHRYRFVDCDFIDCSWGIHVDSFSDETEVGLVTVDGCYFEGNEYGVENDVYAIEVSRSTFNGNRIGVIYRGSRLGITSSTFSGNSIGISVGGDPIKSEPFPVTIRNSTFSRNEYSLSGGLDGFSIKATILNSLGENCERRPGPDTTPVSDGFNIQDDFTCELDHHTDMYLYPFYFLSDLGDYGGGTPVHMPLEGSPVIDMGPPDCPRRDQRGYKRPTDGDEDGLAVCDCGAVEYNSYPLPTVQEFEPPQTEFD
jgi:hypothetical protein